MKIENFPVFFSGLEKTLEIAPSLSNDTIYISSMKIYFAEDIRKMRSKLLVPS